MMQQYKIIFTGLLFVLLASFLVPEQLPKMLTGKWYHTQNGTYTKASTTNHSTRWYEFHMPSKISFSTCTDWCGCMRKTVYGTYTWENDSVLLVTYTKVKRQYGHSKTKLKAPRQEKLKISGRSTSERYITTFF